MVQLPKHLLKSQDFQKECVTSAVELLSVHFSQWSCHISFPELATVPIIRLRKFHETACTESSKRGVKRLIDQVCTLEQILINEPVPSYFHSWGHPEAA